MTNPSEQEMTRCPRCRNWPRDSFCFLCYSRRVVPTHIAVEYKLAVGGLTKFAQENLIHELQRKWKS